MIPDMKELIDKATEMGYNLVKYDEFEKKKDELISEQFMLVFEKE